VLTGLGFEVECRPMDGRLPFANLLLVARHRAARACTIHRPDMRRAAGIAPTFEGVSLEGVSRPRLENRHVRQRP